jgi:predicted short-subunit dehydrogenase-like oxidoreductase (DUF2520 family)
VRKPTIAIVGAGNLARALAPALRRAGYTVTDVVVRNCPDSLRRGKLLAKRAGARIVTLEEAKLDSEVLWICVTDDAIAATARVLASRWHGRVALHSSGALTADALAPWRKRGTAVASIHPMMTFVGGGTPSLADVPFAVEGDRTAVRMAGRIAKDLGGRSFAIASKSKTLYHAMGSFSSPLVIATLAMAERVGRAAGIPRRDVPKIIEPILRQTLKNYSSGGAATAFSGPIVRADIETIRKHLRALRAIPGARDAYLALARSAVENLPVRDRRALRKLFES